MEVEDRATAAAGTPPIGAGQAETSIKGVTSTQLVPADRMIPDQQLSGEPAEGNGDAGSVGNRQNDVLPETGAKQLPDATLPVDTPSLLDDPAGAISHMLTPGERRADVPHDLSPWGMFMAADLVVKAVMIGLAFASLVTWTVWLAKSLELMGARARANRTLAAIRASKTLHEAVQRVNGRGGPASLMLKAAKEEVDLSDSAIDHAGGAGVKERVSAALGRIEAYAGRRMSKGTGVLATIGSTAPFVGLFGTVWGIMNSFIGISEAQTTNLAVVAPGIAEALLATALGLVAAIPAVVIYNVFARSITGYRQLLADAAVGVERLVSRDLDFRKVPGNTASSPAPALAAE
ncbi:tonB-system energizer ExbB [Phyllobacterium sp. K27]